MSKIILLFFALSVTFAFGQDSLQIDNSGIKLQNFYLSLNVENLWKAGSHIDWETGLPDDPGARRGNKTHCSAFVSAACCKLQTYILRPPEHTQLLLANAQFEWLQTEEAQNKGWEAISDTDFYKIFVIAQGFANKGLIVVAVCENPDPAESGHIALVMPGRISKDKLFEDGPLVIQAGVKNYNSIPLKIGFNRHIEYWPEKNILFCYNKNFPVFDEINNH